MRLGLKWNLLTLLFYLTNRLQLQENVSDDNNEEKENATINEDSNTTNAQTNEGKIFQKNNKPSPVIACNMYKNLY